MIDDKMFMKKIKGELFKAWKNGERVTIPMKDILECKVLALRGGFEDTPILTIEIPLLVDDTGFRLSIERKREE